MSGVLALDIPMIDTIGAHVTHISGVIFERLGNDVLATRYLDITTNGVTTREIVGKDALSIKHLAETTEAAHIFLQYLADHPVRELLLAAH